MGYKKVDFSHFTSIGIGPESDVFIIEKDRLFPEGHTIIGHGNNLLIGPNHPPLMMLSKDFDYIKIEEGKLIVGAATPSGKVVSFCKKHDIAHFEFLMKLPGVMGGLVKMNAGLKEYETFNHLLGIVTSRGYIPKEKIPYAYRHTDIDDVIFEAHFEIEKGYDQKMVDLFLKMRDNQPQAKSAGSCFINPEGDFAGRLIEAVGLKGEKSGDVSFSSVHANFLVNEGHGSFEDAIYLIEEAKKRVKAQFDIDMKVEIVILN